MRVHAQDAIDRAGLADRIQVVSGDFFVDPLPPADVVTMGNVLHDWNLEQKLQLIRKAYDALPEGGAFIAIENVIDDARRENTFGLLMSLNMSMSSAMPSTTLGPTSARGAVKQDSGVRTRPLGRTVRRRRSIK